MLPVRSPYCAATLLLLAFLFAANLYRAATQSLVHDEALTWQFYLDGPPAQMFEMYDANHHVLNTLLEKASVSLFGTSEFTLRLPSVIGGLVYLAAVYLLCADFFGGGAWLLLATAWLTLNPFVLDFLSAARGYGMGLALMMVALAAALGYTRGRQDRYLYAAGAAMGLAVSANLTYVFPCAGIAASLAAWVWRAAPASIHADGKQSRTAKRKRRRTEERRRPGAAGTLGRMLLPAAVIGVAIAAEPLSHARREHFQVGTESLWETCRSLAAASLLHRPEWSRLEAWAGPIGAVLAAGAIAAAAVAVWRSWRGPEARLWIPAASLLVTLGLVVAAHFLAGIRYPEGRMALYWIPLAGLTWFARLRQAPRAWQAAGAAAMAAVVMIFALQWNTHFYYVWRYDAGTRRAMEVIRSRHPAPVDPPPRIGATWALEPSLNFYRSRLGLEWIPEVTRAGAEGHYEYYLLMPNDHKLVDYYKLKVLARDDTAETVLAAR